MPTEYYFPDEDAYKAVLWNDTNLFSSSPGSESVTGSSTSSSNSSISGDLNLRYGGPLAKIAKTVHNLDFNGHKKLNRSQSEPRRYRHNNGTTSNKYKTELCHTFTESGGKNCKYGDKCQYAHGEEELRVVARHPKYKTELCKTFHASEDAICPYGHRCHFIHRTPLPLTNANTYYVMPNGMVSACSSLRDLTTNISPYGTSPTSSVFSFDGSMSPFIDTFSSISSPPPSPIEARLPVFDKLSRTASLPFGGLTA